MISKTFTDARAVSAKQPTSFSGCLSFRSPEASDEKDRDPGKKVDKTTNFVLRNSTSVAISNEKVYATNGNRKFYVSDF